MDNIFLACFAFGVLFTVLSVVLGFAGHGLTHLGHGHAGGHGPIGGHPTATHDQGSGHTHPAGTAQLPWLNGSSVVGALTWFGAAGYLLHTLGDLALPAVILGAVVAGGAGWYLVARFLGLVLAGEREMDPDDYRLEGTVGHLNVSIPIGGTGEVVFSKAGARRSEAARALGGAPIARGSEVVITSYADGFAIVQPWGEFIAARDRAVAQNREAQKQA